MGPQEKLFKSIRDVLVEHGVLMQRDILDPKDLQMREYKSELPELPEPYPRII